MSSAESDQASLGAEERAELLRLARESIRYGLRNGTPLPVQPAEFPQELKRIGASFVTLEERGELRGCIGHLEGVQPLVVDVVENAYNAAFRDPRFPSLREDELAAIDIQVSILSPPKPVSFRSEADLLAKLRPGIDGLILEDDSHRGTFLPSVWDSLPEPGQFFTHLKLKAGLAANHWSDRIRVSRYTTESFGERTPS
ncbi:MAG: AmmeMemoRadiSam system protein A [Gammaproteobacteria bacterium]|jgi:uncharacterized protein